MCRFIFLLLSLCASLHHVYALDQVKTSSAKASSSRPLVIELTGERDRYHTHSHGMITYAC